MRSKRANMIHRSHWPSGWRAFSNIQSRRFSVMSKTDDMSGGPGIQAGRARRRHLWVLFMVVGGSGGEIDAALLRMIRHSPQAGPPLPAAAAVVAALLLLLLLYGGVSLYLRLADELERQDNLIGFSVGFLFNIGAFL